MRLTVQFSKSASDIGSAAPRDGDVSHCVDDIDNRCGGEKREGWAGQCGEGQDCG